MIVTLLYWYCKVDTSVTHESVFAVDERGQPLSLATVLHHERKQYDTLLALLHSSLRELQRAVQVRTSRRQH